MAGIAPDFLIGGFLNVYYPVAAQNSTITAEQAAIP